LEGRCSGRAASHREGESLISSSRNDNCKRRHKIDIIIPLARKAKPSRKNLVKQLRREFEKFSCRKPLARSSKSEDARKRLPYHNIQNMHNRTVQNCMRSLSRLFDWVNYWRKGNTECGGGFHVIIILSHKVLRGKTQTPFPPSFFTKSHNLLFYRTASTTMNGYEIFVLSMPQSSTSLIR